MSLTAWWIVSLVGAFLIGFGLGRVHRCWSTWHGYCPRDPEWIRLLEAAREEGP